MPGVEQDRTLGLTKRRGVVVFKSRAQGKAHDRAEGRKGRMLHPACPVLWAGMARGETVGAACSPDTLAGVVCRSASAGAWQACVSQWPLCNFFL